MGLTSTEFIVLLPIVILVYYIFPQKIRQCFLLIINLLFYATFGIKYVWVIFCVAFVAWISAILMQREVQSSKAEKNTSGSSVIFVISVFLMLLTLVVFRIGTIILNSIVAPLGISFYMMQAISYVADVHTRKIVKERNYLKLLIYLSFFPTITSGPIYRFEDFNRSYNSVISDLKADYERITNGIIYILYGYFLKLVIAERAAIPVNKVFNEFEGSEYGGILLFIIAITYSLQIYADFAGYSAIVIGIAQILGYDIPENFSAPYLSSNIKEFWGRWHISLSTWLRDYVYIPLGGNRKGTLRKYINLIITFLVSGMWHGFRWHYLVWGLLHGSYQIIGETTYSIRKRLLPYFGIIEESLFYKLLQRFVTFILVTIAWIFFRTGLRGAVKYILEMITTMNLGGIIQGELWEMGLPPFGWILLGVCSIVVLLFDIVLYKRKMRIDSAINSQGSLAKGIFVIVLSLSILILGIYGDQHDASYFVYRDF